MFRAIDIRLTLQRSNTKVISLAVVAMLLIYSILTAVTPLMTTDASASGGYDPYAPTIYDEEQSATGQGGAGSNRPEGANSEGGAATNQSGDNTKKEDTGAVGSAGQGGDGQNQEGKTVDENNGAAVASECTEFMGLCWYWWAPIAIAAVAGLAYAARKNAVDENQA